MRKLIYGVVALCLSFTALADKSGEGDGTVIEVDREGKALLVQHGEIPGMMGPMTMQFTVDDGALLEGVHEADEIHFTVEQRPPVDWVITKLKVTKPAPGK